MQRYKKSQQDYKTTRQQVFFKSQKFKISKPQKF